MQTRLTVEPAALLVFHRYPLPSFIIHASDFDAQSEHVTLETFEWRGVPVQAWGPNVGEGYQIPFYGWAGAL